MKAIKFRGKQADNGKWVYGDLINYANGDKAIIAEKLSRYGYEATEIHKRVKVIPETAGQYTGIKDLYLGDIFHLGDKNIKYVIVWHDLGFTGKAIRASDLVGLSYWQEHITKIGNIHDNPELLEVE